MSKAEHIRNILERRIRHGDYLLTGLPGERELAQEWGVSRMTARKAVQWLLSSGLLEREPNGRLTVSSRHKQQAFRVAFLVPSLSSPDIMCWRLAIEQVVNEIGGVLRTILYVHWDDPSISAAFSSFNGVFLTPSCEPIPDRLLKRIKEAEQSIVVLGRDMTADGIPSVCLFPPSCVQRLLDVLGEAGHRSVDCFNVQTIDPVITGRIEQWTLWRAAHRIDGRLLGEPIQPYQSPLDAAYLQMKGILERGELRATALLCTTAPAAIGAVRAMCDAGIRVGSDISVCTINDEGWARYTNPSLTSIQMPDPTPYIRVCLEWMQRKDQGKDQGWIGSLLMQPAQSNIFIGESTGPPPASSSRPPINQPDA